MIEQVHSMLTFMRPAWSAKEEDFIKEFIAPVANCDDFGNYITIVGKNPTTMFSSHTDSVHNDSGHQKLIVDPHAKHIFLDLEGYKDKKPKKKNGKKKNKYKGLSLSDAHNVFGPSCLGADDAAGVWLMLSMINNGIPGVYIFHRAEEIGGQGSTHIVNTAKGQLWFDQLKRAVAFDRRGTSDIITHQSGGRCCSNKFGHALSAQLGMNYKNSDMGTFTDTATYMYEIPECTNVSVGYYNEHTQSEYLDFEHLERLQFAVMQVDWENLPVERDPEKEDFLYSGSYRDYSFATEEELLHFVRNYPEAAATLLLEQGTLYEEIIQDDYFDNSFELDATELGGPDRGHPFANEEFLMEPKDYVE